MDGFLSNLNTDAKSNLPDIKNDIVTTYKTTVENIDDLLKKRMAITDLFMSFEIAGVMKKKVEDVAKSFEKKKAKGWAAIAKDMGIKPGSPEFHQLKETTKKKSENPKSNKGKGMERKKEKKD